MTVDASVISGSSVVKLARGVRLREDSVRGRTVLLAPERAIALDDIAIRIVQALDGKRSLDCIATDFAATFEAPAAQIGNDVVAFVKELSLRRMLELVQ
ncbi:pyrroloquinoline quinone biosynthesis peptide chaperone PqqD [Ensifer sp. BR816]|uniref:pyrroloquinoline quinone biosynthesis peptide chaperone PqqD n=1 Tax=Rhizobium sp. (strain BR816) TaxID=1057002 RepID=UPI000370D8F0|nr:pyrroloquinoline quinone biosynthesis peptide chaperone PqqD [Ensifer sp. BR816]